MNTPSPDITDIEIDRSESLLRLTWSDGVSGALSLVEVRLACPCAQCRGRRDAEQTVWPEARSPQPLSVDGADTVGAWGLSITWNDGHATGIYPFEALRTWCLEGSADLPADSGLGGVG